MLLFCLFLREIQILYHIINVVRYILWRVLYRDLVICAIYTVLLLNALISEYTFKALRLSKRSQEEGTGGEEFL